MPPHSPRDSLVPFLPQSSSRRSCYSVNHIMEAQHDGGYGCGELQVSVSFGRFHKDSLSWEKWSSFSPNKYLEEVDKCSIPGSVARKAAYFEAHYKRIAARKAELLLLASSSSSDNVAASTREVIEEGYHSIQKQHQEEEEEEEQNEDGMITLEKERLSFEVVVGESIDGRVADRCWRSDEEKKNEDGSVKDDLKEEEEEEIPAVSGSCNDIIHREEAADCELANANVETGNAVDVEMSARIREDTAKLESWRKPHKIDPLHKEKIMEKAKEKPAPAIVKSPKVYSTLRRTTSERTSISPAPSTTKPMRKPGIMDVSTKRNNGGPAVDLKKVFPSNVCRPTTSSIPRSFDPTAIVAPRRPLIRERMSDKDIINRAFKTFQNHVGLSKSFYADRSSAQKSAPFAVTGDASSTGSWKGNMRLKDITAIKKSNKVLPSPYGSRSTERAEKRIEVNINKKREQKSTVKEAEKSRLQSKTKEQREKDAERLTQSIGIKAMPMPSFYRRQNKPVSNQRKMVKKKENQV